MSSLTWAEISQISASGKASQCFSVGDTKALTKPSGVNAIFVHNRGAGRMVFCTSKNVMSSTIDYTKSYVSWGPDYYMAGGYDLKADVDAQIYDVFDSDVIDAAKIQTIKGQVWRGNFGDGTLRHLTVSASGKFYIPGARNVGFSTEIYEDVQFSYFSSDSRRALSGESYLTRTSGAIDDVSLSREDEAIYSVKVSKSGTEDRVVEKNLGSGRNGTTYSYPVCFEV